MRDGSLPLRRLTAQVDHAFSRLGFLCSTLKTWAWREKLLPGRAFGRHPTLFLCSHSPSSVTRTAPIAHISQMGILTKLPTELLHSVFDQVSSPSLMLTKLCTCALHVSDHHSYLTKTNGACFWSTGISTIVVWSVYSRTLEWLI